MYKRILSGLLNLAKYNLMSRSFKLEQAAGCKVVTWASVAYKKMPPASLPALATAAAARS